MTLAKPMLAKVYKDDLYRPGMLVQPKLNGVRAMYMDGQLVSRGHGLEAGKVWAEGRMRHILDALKDVKGVILDGELYCHGMSLQQINSRASVNATEPHEDEKALTYCVFDYVSRTPAVKRQVALVHLFSRFMAGRTSIQLVTTYRTKSKSDGLAHFERAKRAGFEGLMYRHPDKPYAIVGEHPRKDNRVDWLLKRKDWLDDEATIVRLNEGKNRFEGTLGSFTLLWNGVEFDAGSGMSDPERHQYWALGDKMLGQWVKFQYEMTSDDGKPLKPVVLLVNTP